LDVYQTRLNGSELMKVKQARLKITNCCKTKIIFLKPWQTIY